LIHLILALLLYLLPNPLSDPPLSVRPATGYIDRDLLISQGSILLALLLYSIFWSTCLPIECRTCKPICNPTSCVLPGLLADLSTATCLTAWMALLVLVPLLGLLPSQLLYPLTKP